MNAWELSSGVCMWSVFICVNAVVCSCACVCGMVFRQHPIEARDFPIVAAIPQLPVTEYRKNIIEGVFKVRECRRWGVVGSTSGCVSLSHDARQ
jgi:hypothetical protein